MLDLIYKKDQQKIAIIEKNKVKTYQDLNKDIKEIDNIFDSRQIIILLCNNSYECLLIYLACLKKGSIPLLLSDNVCESHLKEYIKEWMEFHKSERDCSNESEEETFEIVMEDVISSVSDYSFYDYKKDEN